MWGELGPGAFAITMLGADDDVIEDPSHGIGGVIDTGGGPIDGAVLVRTVFVTEATAADVAGTMRRGDKLVKLPGDSRFRWCDASGCSEDRDAVAAGVIAEPKLVDYVFPGQETPPATPGRCAST